MSKVEFVIDLDQIIGNAIWHISDEDWFKKEGYNIVYPKISEKLKQEIKNSEKLIKQDKYSSPSEIKEIIKKEISQMDLEEIRKKVEENWVSVEQKFFEMVPDIVGKQFHYEKYACYFTPYGPGGSYDGQTYKSFVVKANENFTNKNKTIMHELIHCLIQEDIKSNDIDHWTKERIVDLYLVKTDLKNLFEIPPKIQRSKIPNPVDEIFEKTTNIYEIMEELKK